MGDRPLAAERAIPDFGNLDAAEGHIGKDYLPLRWDYRLDVDNIMDLSHIDYLHATTLGGSTAKEVESDVIQSGKTVYSRRLARNERLSPELERRDGLAPGTLVDRWLDVRWEAPSYMELLVGSAPAGSADPRAADKSMHFQHLFTPETETTSHYWFSTSAPRSGGDKARDWALQTVKFLRAPFENEDLPMLEAQQKAMGQEEFWELKPVLLTTDAAAVRARRVLDNLIAAESGRSVGSDPAAG
jgi:vanillate O-demethylase monooxygenase subunit